MLASIHAKHLSVTQPVPAIQPHSHSHTATATQPQKQPTIEQVNCIQHHLPSLPVHAHHSRAGEAYLARPIRRTRGKYAAPWSSTRRLHSKAEPRATMQREQHPHTREGLQILQRVTETWQNGDGTRRAASTSSRRCLWLVRSAVSSPKRSRRVAYHQCVVRGEASAVTAAVQCCVCACSLGWAWCPWLVWCSHRSCG